MRRRVPRVCSGCGVIQGVTSPVYRFRPQGFSRRQFNLGKYDGRLDARSERRVLYDAQRSLYSTVLLWKVGGSETHARLQTSPNSTP